MTLRSSACAALALALATANARADGFRNPPDGAAALGRIGGTYAQIDDATAASRNPANLVEIPEPEFIASVTLGYAEKKFTRADEVAATGAGGSFDTTAESVDNLAFLPGLYLAYPVRENVAGGLAVTVPFGRSTTWEEDSLFRYTAPFFSQLYGVNVNPNIAVKIGERVSVAAGVDLLWSTLDIKQVFPWSMVTGDPAARDGEAEFQGDGTGIGGNAAINFYLTEKQKLSLTYRSPIAVHYEGDATVTHVPAALPPPLAGVTGSSDFSTDITFPAVAAVAYGIRLTDTLRVEFDVEWVQHSTFDELTVDAGNNNVLLASTTTPGDWTDTITYGLGGDWQFSPDWKARAGWIHLDTPIPEQTQIPSIAEEDQDVLSVGLGWAKNGHRVDVAYAYGLFDGRKVDNNSNPLYNGTYDFNAHLLELSYGLSF